MHSQAAAGGRVQRGARGGAAGLAGRGAPGAARASGPRRHVHEAAHLDAHALLEGRLPRRRHARAPRSAFSFSLAFTFLLPLSRAFTHLLSLSPRSYQLFRALLLPLPSPFPPFPLRLLAWQLLVCGVSHSSREAALRWILLRLLFRFSFSFRLVSIFHVARHEFDCTVSLCCSRSFSNRNL